MRELDYYTKSKKVVESCNNYTQLLVARKYVNRALLNISNPIYVKELRNLIDEQIEKLYVQ